VIEKQRGIRPQQNVANCPEFCVLVSRLAAGQWIPWWGRAAAVNYLEWLL